MRISLLKSVIITLLGVVSLGIWVPSTHAQGGNLGSNSSPVLNRQGQPLPGVNIAVCQPVTISSASLSNNLITFNLAIPSAAAAGFTVGMQVLSQGFTGTDATNFNVGSFSNNSIRGPTILSVGPQSITFATSTTGTFSSSTFGTVVGQGTSTTSCAGLSQVFSDPVLQTVTANPFKSDQLGNWNVFSLTGIYYIQFYSSSTGSTIKIIVSQGGSLDIRPLNNNFTGSNNFFGGLLINSLPAIAVQGVLTPGDCISAFSASVIQDFGQPCGSGGGGGQSFATISSGTNTQATMIVGTGAVVTAAGGGQVNATTAPFSGLAGGTLVAQALVVGNSSSLNPSGTGVINANRINGTTVPVNSAADQALLTSASAVGLWSSIPICLDAAGQHLNYNTATHAFSCGTSGGTAGSAAFNTITSGTNASAAMVVGTGATLTASGSGSIAATTAPFAGILSGTNTTSNMVLGTGSSLTVSGSGTNNATSISGTTIPASSAADQVINTTASGTGQWTAVPGCLDAGGNHLNYNTTTHLFSCGTSGGTAGSAAFNTITSGTNASAAMVVGTGSSLGFSGSGTITASAMLFSGLTTSTNTTATMTVGTGAVMTTSGTGQINANIITGTTVPANAASDQVLLTTAVSTGSWASVPNCLDTSGQHINYNISTHSFACGTTSSGGGGGGAGTVIASPQYTIGFFPNSGSVATIQGSSIFTDGTFKNLFVPGTTCISGPSPWVDITCPPYNARPVQINTTATGSGSSITVGVTTFQNNDWITIAAVGNAPSLASPSGLTVTPMVSGGMTTFDNPTIAGLAATSTYQYTIFPIDVLGGAGVPLSPVTITTGNPTIGSFPPFTISTLSITGSTLTIVTSSPTGLPNNAQIHVTKTSNNHLFEGWYPISSISGSTITVNSISQYCQTACTGTGGQLVAFVGNALTWTPNAPVNSTSSTWEYGICAKRPGDSALHLVGTSYPQTLYNSGSFLATVYNDYGPSFNAAVPWYLSDANCTAGSPQPQLYTGQIVSGGGTTTLGVTPPLPSAASGQSARYDASPPIRQALLAAAAAFGTAYVPPSGVGTFPINSPLLFSFKGILAQTGQVTVNNPVILPQQSTWYGFNSAISTVQSGSMNSPQLNCAANPCLYAGGINNQSAGSNVFTGLSFTSSLNNNVMLLIDGGGTTYLQDDSFITTANDVMGSCVMLRPGSPQYYFTHLSCAAGGSQVIDSTWAPGVYADGLCGGGCGGIGSAANPLDVKNYTQTHRGFYSVATQAGTVIVAANQVYSQGTITPNFTVQGAGGSMTGQVSIDFMQHDTESQAAFASICGIGCASAFNGVSGIAVSIGHAQPEGADSGSFPWQITGGGNARTLIDLAVFAQGGNEQGIVGANAPSRGVYFSQNRVFNYGGVLTSDPQLGISDFSPNVATPTFSLEQGSFLNNEVSAILTSNQTRTAPNASGVECLTGLVDCSYTLDTGLANAYVTSVPAISALVDGMKFRIKAAHANTTTSTLVVNALPSHNIQKFQSGSLVNLAANDISLNCDIELTWDAGDAVYQLTNPCNGGSGGGSGIVGNCTVPNSEVIQTATGTTTNCTPEAAAARFETTIDSGAVNAYVGTTPVPLTSYQNGDEIYIVPLNTNTGTATINIDGQGVVPLQKFAGSNLIAGDFTAANGYVLRYSSLFTAWMVLNPSGLASPVTIANGGTGQTSAGPAFNALAPSTSLNGLIVGSGLNAYGNLAGVSGTLTCCPVAWTAPATISGSGATGQVPFFSGTTTLQGSTNWTYNSVTGMVMLQGANGNTVIGGSRFTDTAPTGFFENWLNHAGNQTVYSIDATGNIVSQGSLQVGSISLTHNIQIPGATPSGCLAGSFSITADASGNGMLCNNNAGNVYIAFAGADINSSSQVVSTHLTAPSANNIPRVVGGNLVSSFLSDNTTNGAASEDLDMITNSIVVECTNDTTTGTTNNLLAEIPTTGCIKATATLTTPAYIVERGGGTSGVAQIVSNGVGHCTMDANNASGTFGWFVIKSATVGDCHAQSAAPSVGQWLVGQLLSTSTTTGAASPVNALNEFYTSSGAGTGTVTSVATTSPITGGTFTTSGTIGCATCVVSASTPNIGVGHFAGGTQTITSNLVIGSDISNHAINATQLATQYSTWSCQTGEGDGLNAIPAGTYLQFYCTNTTGVTVTISAFKCWTDNAGTSTLQGANNAASNILTGAVTCNNTKSTFGAAGTLSITTLAANDSISFTFVADGTSKQGTFTVTGTY